jgi:CRP-like cAMP-binding protein
MSGSAPDRMWPFQHRVLKAGEVLFREGERAHQEFIIESGSASLSGESPGAKREIVERCLSDDKIAAP